jgi:hypothetical protein
MDIHSSLLQKFVNYGCKFFYNIGPQIGERAQAIATFALCGFANPVNIYYLSFPARNFYFRSEFTISGQNLPFPVRIYLFQSEFTIFGKYFLFITSG